MYGRQVNDFHLLDYNSMFSLGFSGVKELIKLVKEKDQQIKDLQNRIAVIEQYIATKLNKIKATCGLVCGQVLLPLLLGLTEPSYRHLRYRDCKN